MNTLPRTRKPRPVAGPSAEGHHVHPAWPRMVERFRTAGLATSYPNDFWIHDANFIGGLDPREPFFWFLYGGGTHLYRTMHRDAYHGDPMGLLRTVLRDFGTASLSPKGSLLFYWDGVGLLGPCDLSTAESYMRKDQEELREKCSACFSRRTLHGTPEHACWNFKPF